jgi:hypothetical protein
MSGYFYATTDLATMQAIVPSLFAVDELSGETAVIQPAQAYKATGLVTVSAIRGEVDPETGDQEILTPAVMSDPFVILSGVAIPLLAGYEVTDHPEDQGYA